MTLALMLLVIHSLIPTTTSLLSTYYIYHDHFTLLEMEPRKAPDDWQFHVAPMQCYTNAPLRTLFRSLSDKAILWTEMEKTSDLLEGSLERRFGPPGHYNIVLQLGGNNAMEIRACMELLAREGYSFDEVNLNCGCPSVETGGAANYGASLMKQPELTRELLESIVSSVGDNCNVSLKCRTGVVASVEELETSTDEYDAYTKLHHYIQYASDAGIDHLILHARPAVLAGLNPSKNRQVPPLNYEIVNQIARNFSNLKVTLNGGIQSMSDLTILKEGDGSIASHMAGRWMLRRPLDLAHVHDTFLTGESTDNVQLSSCIDEYSSYIEKMMRSRNALPLSELCLPLYLVSEQLREDYDALLWTGDSITDESTDVHDCFVQEDEFDSLYDSLKDAVEMLSFASNGGSNRKKALPQTTNFKKISSCFKGLVGTKVANKWKRNRSEL